MVMKLGAWLLSLGICLCATLPGRAQDNPPANPSGPDQAVQALLDAAAEYDKTLAPFHSAHQAIVSTLMEAGTLPGLENPLYAGAVSQAFDISALEKQPPMTNLIGMCNEANATQAVYIIYGARKEDLDPFAIQPRLKPEPTARIAKLKSENYLRFQNELVAALGFLLTCRTQELEGLKTYLGQMSSDEMAVFRIGFADFQDSLTETVTYHAEALRYPIRPENRQAVLDLLTQYIDPLAAGMTKQSRKAAAAAIAKALAASKDSPDAVAKLTKVQQALKRTDCARVCAFR